MRNKLRVLVADDHTTVRVGLRTIIDAQSDMQVVGEAPDGREAVRLARELRPDVVLMDVSMPELNGLKASAQLKRICPEIKILILTRHTDDAYLQELLQVGVSGYVLKQSAPSELLNALRAVAAGGSYLDPAIAGKVFTAYAGRQQKPRGETAGEAVSAREAEVLRRVALGYSNKEIAAELDISIKTVEAHKANALKKLGMTSRKDIIRYAILQGWLQEG